MLVRALHFGVDECAVAVEPPRTPPAAGWVWIDVTAGPDDLDELAVLTEESGTGRSGRAGHGAGR